MTENKLIAAILFVFTDWILEWTSGVDGAGNFKKKSVGSTEIREKYYI